MDRERALSALVAIVLVVSLSGCVQPWADGGGTDGQATDATPPSGEGPTDDGSDAGESATDDGSDADESATDDGSTTDAPGPPTDDGSGPNDGPNRTVEPGSGEGGNVTATFLAPGGNVTVSLEVADTSAERSEGLMGRQSLPDRHGMVFVYEQPDSRSFWMKNTDVPLDIAFLDENATVVNVEHARPQPDVEDDADLERYRSDGPAQYVIELERGFANETGVGPGTEVAFHDGPHNASLEIGDASLESSSRDRRDRRGHR